MERVEKYLNVGEASKESLTGSLPMVRATWSPSPWSLTMVRPPWSPLPWSLSDGERERERERFKCS